MLSVLPLLLAAAPTSYAVMELEAGRETDPDLARQLTARVAQIISRRPEASVIAPDDIRALLLREQQRQLLGCTDQGCLAEIAGALGASQIISGRVARIDEGWSITLSLVDAVEVSALGRTTATWGGTALGLIELMDPLVASLFSDAPEALAGALEFEGAESGSEVSIDGRARGVVPDPLGPLPAGGREVVLSKSGFVPWRRWVVIRPGRTTRVVVEQTQVEGESLTSKWWFWSLIVAGAAGGATAIAVAASGGDGSTTGVQVGVNVDDAITGGR